ncbi:MAG: hypothetical protein V3U16_01025, partial [Candidatus Neomarinimicrobiota bacterium]
METKSKFVIPFLLFIILPSDSWCQTDNIESTESLLRFQGFYVSIMHINISGFPLTHMTDFYGSPMKKPIKSSSSGLAYAFGIQSVIKNKLYGGLEFEFSKISFTDERVSNRYVYFY